MNNTLGTLAPPLPSIPVTRKTAARVALAEVKDPARSLLAECFRQFGIETVLIAGDAANRLKQDKFDACVVRLAQGAEGIMESVRTSPSNSRLVLYGLGGSVAEAMRFSKYGVNAVFSEPLDRSSALKLVRATQTLVFHEFRRYVRIPVITEVAVISESHRFTATSQEISAGGMSLRSAEPVAVNQPVEISFALLTLPRTWVNGRVTWCKPSRNTFGIRFDAQDERRLRIKEWIDAYLED
jgi:Tfp pilus assembly protein PilZ